MFRVLETINASDPWDAQRRPPRHADEALTGTARQWLRRLPARRRPMRLCIAYPRVANALASHWCDSVQSAVLLEDLLQDRRGARRGFPPQVMRELRRLREFNAQQRVEVRPEAVSEIFSRLLAW
jgi:hypothetical protein